MILIGQYDSPFVRRVGITLRRYGIAYEHRRWSVWGDADQLAQYNPLRRVPTLLLEDGTALVETFAIVDTLDELIGPERALLPRSGPLRREGLRLTALASGLADKAVSLLYEKLFRPAPSQLWIERCQLQIAETLSVLEADRAARTTRFWLGSELSHPDIAFACAYRFMNEAHPGVFGSERLPGRCPALEHAAAACEALEDFQAMLQPIVNNL